MLRLQRSCCHHSSLFRPIARGYFTRSSPAPPPPKPVLTEHVYGRTRIYTSSLGKTKATAKTCIASPVTSPPSLTWEWLHPQDTAHGATGPHENRRRTPHPGASLISGVKQNMRELFLPVGYPDALHDCYKKFHLWLGLETYVGSAVSGLLDVIVTAFIVLITLLLS
jgi:hypothetical protein